MFGYVSSIAAGVVLDRALGDPHGLPHPVRAVGRLIERSERLIRRVFPDTRGGQLWGGALLVLIVCMAVWGCAAGLCALAGRAGAWALWAARALLSYYLLAARSLRDESGLVYEYLKKGDTEGARHAVSMIVGRDTQRLEGEEIARAAVETVAENTSDGVIAPLFYLFLGGPALGWLYKAVNTMDSMVGYRNERYLYFGRAAARLDDAANMLPSRLSALFMALAALLLGFDARGAVRIWRRDRRKHKSPNSAQTEAACAGALGVRLGGDAWYFGLLHKKPWIGDAIRPLEYEDIARAGRLMYRTEDVALAAGMGVCLCAALLAGLA